MKTEKDKTKRGGRLVAAILIISLAELLLVLAALVGLDSRRVCFYMNEEQEITVPYGRPYQEPGVRAVSVGRITGESGEELPVYVDGGVDTQRPGPCSGASASRASSMSRTGRPP